MRQAIWAVLAVGILCLSGCAGNFGITEKFSETNQLIADANNDRLREFAQGMAACGDNAACQVGVSMAFAGNIGQQQFFKPETVKDYLVAFMPYATLGVDVARLWRSPGGDSQGMVVTGDGNNFIGVGNKTAADNGSSLSYDTPAYLTYNTTSQNKTTDSGPVTNSGTAPPPEVVVVEPMVFGELSPLEPIAVE